MSFRILIAVTFRTVGMLAPWMVPAVETTVPEARWRNLPPAAGQAEERALEPRTGSRPVVSAAERANRVTARGVGCPQRTDRAIRTTTSVASEASSRK